MTMRSARTIVIPVVNVDGFTVSRTAGPMAGDEDEDLTLALALNDQMAYKRKHCRRERRASLRSFR